MSDVVSASLPGEGIHGGGMCAFGVSMMLVGLRLPVGLFVFKASGGGG